MVKKFFNYFLILFFLVGNLFAQNISVTAGTDSVNYLIGDYINYRLVVRSSPNLNVSVPQVADSVNQLELISEGEVIEREEEGEKILIYNYIYSVYDSADVVIPPAKITYGAAGQSFTGTAESNPVEISVHSLAIDPEGEIRDIKEPMRISLNWLLILWIALTILILLLVGYLLYKFFKQKKVEEIPERKNTTLPVHVRTLSMLNDLEKKELWQNERVKEYHTEITFIIRDYFEKRFYFPALRVTSGDILVMMKRYISDKKVLYATEKFFENADLVKFAKYKPLPEVNEEMMKQAYFIVEKTTPEEPRETERLETETADV